MREFVTTGLGAPFEQLVRRYHALVVGVCLWVLKRSHDAEDVVQAVFLTLAYKARSLQGRPSIADWLRHAAYNVSYHALRSKSRHRRLEQRAMEMKPGSAGKESPWQEIEPLLDGALDSLPERYRVPLVQHYLQQRPEEDVARELGCTRSAVSMRLLRGREMLRSRLTRSGVVVSGAVLAMLMAERVASAASPALVASIVKSATLATAGKAAASGLVSTQVSAWVKGGLKAMMWTKIKIAAAVMAISMAGLGGGALAYRALAEPAPQSAPAARVRALPKDLPPEIPAARFKALHEMIMPAKGECQWMEIPWLTGIQEAREKAAKEGKPMLIWRSANGHPTGST